MIGIVLQHPFWLGFVTGGALVGGALGILGWQLGYEAAMRTAAGWMRSKRDEIRNEILPPARSRRPIATTPGRSV